MLAGRRIDFRTELLVMGIVNTTPDSFYDRGSTVRLDDAVEACRRHAAEGADWVDIGGVPFAPGEPLEPRIEAQRVVPVIERAAEEHPGLILSVDTFHASVADACLAAGAHVVNDTTGFSDPELADVVREHDAHVIVTHSLVGPGGPRTAVPRPHYEDVVAEVRGFLEHRIGGALERGIPEDRILADPGHDLNKTTEHSLELTRRLREITQLGHPTLAAVSHKDFVGEALGLPRDQRLEGSLAAAVLCAAGGARIFRMHEAGPARRALDMAAVVLGLREPAQALHNTGDANA
ncbi:dihydropteroate synthase [Kocuria palustris]|uniref:dihydropteroate synthase n=1 Tax=Kocuria palustris TaxID=71999 RepID=UPI0037C18F5D